jgi:hypothetical protein
MEEEGALVSSLGIRLGRGSLVFNLPSACAESLTDHPYRYRVHPSPVFALSRASPSERSEPIGLSDLIFRQSPLLLTATMHLIGTHHHPGILAVSLMVHVAAGAVRQRQPRTEPLHAPLIPFESYMAVALHATRSGCRVTLHH